jgi:hypothetical protein
VKLRGVLLALAVLLSCSSARADELKDTNLIRLRGEYGTIRDIPGTEEPSRRWTLGETWSTFLKEKVSLDLNVGAPLGRGGGSNLSAGVDLHYYFRPTWFITAGGATYLGEFDRVIVDTGIGWEYPTKGRIVYTVAGTVGRLTDSAVSDPWMSSLVGTVGWRLGPE